MSFGDEVVVGRRTEHARLSLVRPFGDAVQERFWSEVLICALLVCARDYRGDMSDEAFCALLEREVLLDPPVRGPS